MSETTFENAKVGDRVWSYHYGSGKIVRIERIGGYPLCVEFSDQEASYTIKGCELDFENPTLFWAPVEITPPPRPKRMVEKKFIYYINVFDSQNVVTAHRTKENADLKSGGSWGRRLGPAERIVITRTVEE